MTEAPVLTVFATEHGRARSYGRQHGFESPAGIGRQMSCFELSFGGLALA
jgi:hypothetical protein